MRHCVTSIRITVRSGHWSTGLWVEEFRQWMKRDCEALTTFSLRFVLAFWSYQYLRFDYIVCFTMTAALVYSNIDDSNIEFVTKAVDVSRISNRMNNTEEQSTASLPYIMSDKSGGGYVDDSFSNRVRTEGQKTCYSSLSIDKSWLNLCMALIESFTQNPCPSVFKNQLMIESG